MQPSKTHIKCDSSFIRIDACGINDCDICGKPPSYERPVIQLRIQRVLTEVRKRTPRNDATVVSLHKDCFTDAYEQWVDEVEERKRTLLPRVKG